MSDKIGTLHPKGDPSVNIYPNIKSENIPDSSVGKGKLSFAAQTQLYYHAMRINVGSPHTMYITLHIISERSSAYSQSSLSKYLKDNGFDSVNAAVEITGYTSESGVELIGIFSGDGSSLTVFKEPSGVSEGITATGFNDIVIPL